MGRPPAARVAGLGESLSAGIRIPPEKTCCGRRNYYRNAAAFLLDDPAQNPEVAALYPPRSTHSLPTQCVRPPKPRQCPFRIRTTNCRLYVPRGMIRCAPAEHSYTSGYDSTAKRATSVAVADAAPRLQRCGRDGPGQGGLCPCRAGDAPGRGSGDHHVVDYALTRREIEPGGSRFGEDLEAICSSVPRTFEHRLAR